MTSTTFTSSFQSSFSKSARIVVSSNLTAFNHNVSVVDCSFGTNDEVSQTSEAAGELVVFIQLAWAITFLLDHSRRALEPANSEFVVEADGCVFG